MSFVLEMKTYEFLEGVLSEVIELFPRNIFISVEMKLPELVGLYVPSVRHW